VSVYGPSDQNDQAKNLADTMRTTFHELRTAIVRVEKKLVGIGAEQVHHSGSLKSIQETLSGISAAINAPVNNNMITISLPDSPVPQSATAPSPKGRPLLGPMIPARHALAPVFSGGSADFSSITASSAFAGSSGLNPMAHSVPLDAGMPLSAANSALPVSAANSTLTNQLASRPLSITGAGPSFESNIPEERGVLPPFASPRASLTGILPENQSSPAPVPAKPTIDSPHIPERVTVRSASASAQGSSQLQSTCREPSQAVHTSARTYSGAESSLRTSIGSSRQLSKVMSSGGGKMTSMEEEPDDDVEVTPHHRERRVRLRRRLREKWRDLRRQQKDKQQNAEDNLPLPANRASAGAKHFAEDISETARQRGRGERDSDSGDYRIGLFNAIDPTKPFMVVRDISIAVACGFDFLVMPIILAWRAEETEIVSLQLITAITALFWTLNMLLGFRLGYYIHDEVLVNSWRQAARHYLRRFFAFDIITLLCQWGMVISGIMGVSELGKASFWTLRMLGCMVIFRALRFRGSLGRLRDSVHCHPRLCYLFEPVMMAYFYLWCCNTMCCIWFAIGCLQTTDTGRHWLDRRIGGFPETTLAEASMTFQYLESLRYAVSFISLMHAPAMPSNSIESTATLVWAVIGVVLFGALISFLSAKCVWMMQSQESAMQVVDLQNLLIERGVKNPLRGRIVRQLREGFHAARQSKTLHQMDPLLDTISWSLRMELRFELHGHVVTKHPLFKLAAQVESRFVRSFCTDATEPLHLLRGKTAFYPEEDAHRCYYTLSESMVYTTVAKNPGQKDAYYNVAENTWVSEPALWCTWTYAGTLEAVEDCEVVAVESDRVCEQLLKVPEMFHFLMDYTRTYHSRLIAALGEDGDDQLNDLQVPGTDFDELIWLLGTNSRIFAGLVAIEMFRNTRGQWKGIMQQRNVARIDELERQVMSEQSVLIARPSGDVERISLVTAVKVSSGERLLWQLGKWTPRHTLEIEVRLPGQPQIPGESGDAALKRLLRAKLAPFAPGIHVTRSEIVSEKKESKTFHLPTKYSVRVHHAYYSESSSTPRGCVLCENLELLPAAPAAHRSSSRRPLSKRSPSSTSLSSFRLFGSRWSKMGDMERQRSLALSQQEAIAADVYLSVSDSTVYLFAWLTEAESDALQTSAGEAYLKAALNEFSRNAETERRLSSWGWDPLVASQQTHTSTLSL